MTPTHVIQNAMETGRGTTLLIREVVAAARIVGPTMTFNVTTVQRKVTSAVTAQSRRLVKLSGFRTGEVAETTNATQTSNQVAPILPMEIRRTLVYD
jgi:hypothetical protein